MNRKYVLAGLGAAALVVGAGAVAVARGGPDGWGNGGMHGMGGMGGLMGGPMMHQMLRGFDTDKDGKLSQAEIDKARADQLARFDADKDGKLSLKEFEGVFMETVRPMMVRGFQYFDANGDAAVDATEFLEPTNKMVARMDSNNDGFLDDTDRRGRGHGWGRHGGRDDGPDVPDAPAPAPTPQP